jgi:hypothetical protein
MGPFRRDNGLGLRGWEVILQAVEKCSRLESLNGCDQYQDIISGRVVDLQADGCDIAAALIAGQLLHRSASSLTSLNLRCRATAGGDGRAQHGQRPALNAARCS